MECADPPLSRALGARLACPNDPKHALRKLRRPKNGKIVAPIGASSVQQESVAEAPASPTPKPADLAQLETEALDMSDSAESDSGIQLPETVIEGLNETSYGFSARFPRERNKAIEKDGVIYRVPASGVKLDFLQSVYEMRQDPFPDTRNSDILLSLDEIASRGQEPLLERGKVIAQNLPLSEDAASEAALQAKRATVESLIDCALALPSTNKLNNPSKTHSSKLAGVGNGQVKSERTDTIASAVKKNNSSTPDDLDVRPDERSYLVAIKRLMQLKGKEALLEFLVPQTA